MRSLRALAVLLALPTISAVAQVPRLKVASCQAADSILGPPAKEILKAEVYGTIGPGPQYAIHAGPLSMRDYESEVSLHHSVAPDHLVPGGYLSAVLPVSILKDPTAQAEPLRLVLDDTLTIPLGTPTLPQVSGPAPPSLPVKVLLRPADLLLLAQAKKARAEYLGKKAPMDEAHRRGAAAALLIGLCALASQPH